MMDFFALFSQPRRPWLEPGMLKEKHHQLTRIAHPDIHGSDVDQKFEHINEGYRILSDPKLRIEHLLTLEGLGNLAKDRTVPADLQELFLRIATLRQAMQRVLTALGDVTSALKLSLAKNDLLQLQKETSEMLEQLNRSYEQSLKELQNLNEVWDIARQQAIAQLQPLRDRIAYLSRWIGQLKEMELQLKLRG